MEYTTLQNLKDYLGITDNSNDSILEKTITRVSKQFDNYLGRNLGETTYTEYIPTEEDDILIVQFGPITTVSAIKENDSSGDDVSYKRTDANIVYLKAEYNELLYIEYISGYSSLDDIQDVEQACLEVCKDLWDSTPVSGNESNIKSKKIETLSKTYFSKDELTGGIGVDFRETLDNYRTLAPMTI